MTSSALVRRSIEDCLSLLVLLLAARGVMGAHLERVPFAEPLSIFSVTALDDISKARGCLASDRPFLTPPSQRLGNFRALVAAVLLQIEDRDAFVVGRSLQDIGMA